MLDYSLFVSFASTMSILPTASLYLYPSNIDVDVHMISKVGLEMVFML